MAINTQLSRTAVEASAQALANLFSDGYLRIYAGEQPVDGDTAAIGSTLLAELRFAPIAFQSISNGIMVANTIAPVVASDNGSASWFRALESNGTTTILDGSIGTSNANLVLGTTTVSQGLIVNVSSFIHTLAKSYAGV